MEHVCTTAPQIPNLPQWHPSVTFSNDVLSYPDAQSFKKGKEKFKNIQTLREKAQIIKEMLIMYRCDAATVANLKAIGGSANAGSMKIKKNTLTSRSLVLVNQSITGLFETEEELV